MPPKYDFSNQEFKTNAPRLGRRYVRGWLVDTSTDEQYVFQFNPDEINITGGASYASHNILGHSHERDQFNYTKGVNVGFKLEANEILREKDVATTRDTNDYHNFMWSLLYPRIDGPPPILLLVLPGVLRMRVKLLDLNEAVKRWSADGAKIMAFSMDVKFKEELSSRVTSDEVRIRGLFRGSSRKAVSSNLRHGFSPTGRKEER